MLLWSLIGSGTFLIYKIKILFMWIKSDLDIMLELLHQGKSYKEISLAINKSEGSIRSKAYKYGLKSSSFYQPKKLKSNCKECNREFEDLSSRNRIFCSQSCNAKYNNRQRGFESNILSPCLFCGDSVKNKKYCSRDCQHQYEREVTFKKIENGDVTLYEKNYKKYLIYKYGEKCMECGWCEINKKTGKVPIQLEHIDGHSENNSLLNLKLLCPNCHSLTPTYGFLNKGNGRKKRYKAEFA